MLFKVVAAVPVSCSRKPDVSERVLQLREMSELGTVEYTVKKVISANDTTWYSGQGTASRRMPWTRAFSSGRKPKEKKMVADVLHALGYPVVEVFIRDR